MNDKKILKELFIHKDVTITSLSERLGYKHSSGVGNVLQNKNSMRMDIFYKIINELNCELKVIDKDTGREWIVSFDK